MSLNLFILLGSSLFFLSFANAFENNTNYIGIGYYSQNSFNATSQKETGETGFLGEASYPLNFKKDFALNSMWFVAPQFSYTLIPRNSAGNTAKVTIAHLEAQFGKNFDNNFDWFVGPGFLYTTIKGAGGTKELSNGTGTATFAVPGGESTIQKITMNFGTSYRIQQSRIGFEIIVENIFSSKKRAENLMLSYAYMFGK